MPLNGEKRVSCFVLTKMTPTTQNKSGYGYQHNAWFADICCHESLAVKFKADILLLATHALRAHLAVWTPKGAPLNFLASMAAVMVFFLPACLLDYVRTALNCSHNSCRRTTLQLQRARVLLSAAWPRGCIQPSGTLGNWPRDTLPGWKRNPRTVSLCSDDFGFVSYLRILQATYEFCNTNK